MESCAVSRLRSEENSAEVLFNYDVVGDGQSLPSAIANRFGGEKQVENLVVNITRNARSVILNTDFHAIIDIFGRD